MHAVEKFPHPAKFQPPLFCSLEKKASGRKVFKETKEMRKTQAYVYVCKNPSPQGV